MARTDFHKVIVGRSELITFVDLLIEKVPAKIDTGAYRSAVHADTIVLSPDGKSLQFELLGNHPSVGSLGKTVTTKDFKQVRVSNSFGDEEERFEVKLRVKLGPKVFVAAFTLANRSKKNFPILLGRTLLNDRFLIDTAKSSIDRVELKRLFGLEFPTDEEGAS